MRIAADEQKVASALKGYVQRLDEITDFLGDKKSITTGEKEWLQSLLTALKADIKAANKRGKVDDDRAPQTHAERAFFEPALRGASANFRVATNSHPIRSGWFSCLYGVRIDLSYYLHQLEKDHPEDQ